MTLKEFIIYAKTGKSIKFVEEKKSNKPFSTETLKKVPRMVIGGLKSEMFPWKLLLFGNLILKHPTVTFTKEKGAYVNESTFQMHNRRKIPLDVLWQELELEQSTGWVFHGKHPHIWWAPGS